jgi:hypothetical protein
VPDGGADRRGRIGLQFGHRGDRPAEDAEQQRQPSDDVSAVVGHGGVAKRGERGQVHPAFLEGARLQVDRHHAVAVGRVRTVPQQVAEHRVFAGPGQFTSQHFDGEAAVVQRQLTALVIAVPHARPEQDDVADRYRLAAGA